MNDEMIFLLSYAGGSSLSYMGWKGSFTHKKMIAPDYKGHGLRIREPFDDTAEEAAQDIAEQIFDAAEGKEFVIYGHSFGGLIAYECTRVLREKYGMQPKALVISSGFAPMDMSKVTTLSDDDGETTAYLADVGHITPTVYNTDFYKEVLLPIIRNDYRLMNRYRIEEEPDVLHCPIYAFYGEDDRINTCESMQRWKTLTDREFFLYGMPGGHFFFDEAKNRDRLCAFLDEL